ncbi:hypothetical protein GCM10025783_16330 [Amnibacterium soli]|uniref:ANTAR domain-containing protein n=1 Tax=Amnibacterium soli TaxID=1282736 RepID=A0ABP8Z3F7_9MICO
MTFQSTTETVMQPASAALDSWWPAPGEAPWDASRDALVAEQHGISRAIAGTVARMGHELDADLLDDLTDEVAGLLARAEEIRLALALAARVTR